MDTLCCFFARVGDLVMATPVLRALAAQGPLALCARPWARDLLRHEPWLQAIHVLGKPNAPAWQDWLLAAPRWRLGRQLRQRAYQRVVMTSGETQRLAAWIRALVPAERLLVLPLPQHGHAIDALCEGAAACGIAVTDRQPRLTVPEDELAAARRDLQRLGERVVAIQAGSSLTHRWWRRQPNLKGLSSAQWAAFCQRLLERGDADAVVALGSAPEGREARAIAKALPPRWRPRFHDLTGRVPLGRLPALLAACHACISVDTGPAHIAAAVGCPLLVCFGPTSPARFAPRGPGPIVVLEGEAPCRPCHGTPRYRQCRDNRCLRDLSIDRLWAAWQQLRDAHLLQGHDRSWRSSLLKVQP